MVMVVGQEEETKLVRSVTLQPLVNTKFALLWIWDLGIFFLDPTYKWNHAIVVTLYLAKSLNIVSSIFIQIVANGRISSFSEMNNITLYINIGEGWQPTPAFLPGEFHGQRSLAGYSPWGCKESDTTKRLSLSHSYVNIPHIFYFFTVHFLDPFICWWTQVVFMSWMVWIMLQRTWECRFPFFQILI